MTGNVRDVIDGVEVTCIDVAMPMIMMRSTPISASPATKARRDQSRRVAHRIEAIAASGAMMGFGDVTDKVIPKVGLLAPPRDGGTIVRAIYPHALHAAHAVTGAVSPPPARSKVRSRMNWRKPTTPTRAPWIEHLPDESSVLKE